MKCWKCEKEIPDGASVCNYCSASMSRPAPVSAAGRAMRQIYDRFGSEVVFGRNSRLPVALGDLMEDSQKLRGQLNMALSSGVGTVYLNQLQNVGKPDTNFRARIKTLLTDDAGLSEKVAAELMGYFDEMIGWAAPAQSSAPSGGTATQPRPAPAREIPRPTPNNEIPRPNPNREIPRPTPQPAPKKSLLDAPVPQQPQVGGAVMTMVEFSPLLVFAAAFVSSSFLGPWAFLILVGGFLICGSWRQNWDWQHGRADLKCTAKDDGVEVSWTPAKDASGRFAIAVNGEWAAVVSGNSTVLKLDQARSSVIVLAEVTGSGAVCRGTKLYQPKK